MAQQFDAFIGFYVSAAQKAALEQRAAREHRDLSKLLRLFMPGAVDLAPSHFLASATSVTLEQWLHSLFGIG